MKVGNRTFIISGGSSGLGLATVKALISANAFISILDKSPLPVELAGQPQVHFTLTDITITSEIEAAVEAAVAWTEKTGAKLGGVINCAGIAGRELALGDDASASAEASFNKTLAINLFGTFNLSRLAAKHLVHVPSMDQDGERGVIVMTSSVSASEGQAGQIAYAASKGAIDAMILPMARELAPRGVRVLGIAPAGFATPMVATEVKTLPQAIIDRMTLFPKRLGDPSEFASTVLWALQCAYVNGEVIRLTVPYEKQ